MTRNEVFACIARLVSGKTDEHEDFLLATRVEREVTHGNYIDLIFQDMRGLSKESLLNEAIVTALDFMARLAADRPLSDRYRVKLGKFEPALTKHDMTRAITDLRGGHFDLDQRVERLWRLLDDVPHAEIGDLIYRDTQGLTPEQVVDEAIRRQIAHLCTLFQEGDPRRNCS